MHLYGDHNILINDSIYTWEIYCIYFFEIIRHFNLIKNHHLYKLTSSSPSIRIDERVLPLNKIDKYFIVDEWWYWNHKYQVVKRKYEKQYHRCVVCYEEIHVWKVFYSLIDRPIEHLN